MEPGGGGVMLRIGPEPLDDCYQAMDALLQDYFARTIASEGLPPLRMDWLAFQRLENAGALVLVTARDADELVGFVMYLVVPHLHHIGVTVAACDILAVDVDARGRGIARKMVEAAEPILKERGAAIVTHQFRVCYDVKPLFPKLGFQLIEQGYMKELR
jgi:GNAT superfamily N-acetyltransferase